MLLFSLHDVSFGQGSNIQRSNWLLGILFKLEKMKESAVADTQKYEREIQKSESVIKKSEDILRLARQTDNVQAEDIASHALTKAQEAKKTNEGNYYLANKKLENTERSVATVKSILGNQLGVDDRNKDSNKDKEKKQELALPPYFEKGLPPVNCAEGLKALNNKNCYCPEPNRPPVCTKDGKRLKENGKVYVFSWTIEVAGPRGLIRNDGTHIGTYKSYDEAYENIEPVQIEFDF